MSYFVLEFDTKARSRHAGGVSPRSLGEAGGT